MTLGTVMRKRELRWIALASTALAAGAFGGLIVLWVNGTAYNPVVGWFGDWLKSPGFTGLGAIVAASIAFFGISLQLNANRERDADAAWWQSFEWASDRGLPRDPRELRLSFEAALDTLNALATAARTDIQKNAVRGVVDELLRSRESEARKQASAATDREVQAPEQFAGESPDGSSDDPDRAHDESGRNSDGSSAAVRRYVLQQVGTAAESRRASASAYETDVLRALRHQYDKVTPVSGARGGDVIVQTSSRKLVVEIKWASGAILNMSSTAQLSTVDVVISNASVANLPPNVTSVVWVSGKDASNVLRRALDAIR